ncbi:unnamed protein product [Lathyrus sativus]|nr:unnamed protein product [Lathyrus sativus]
MNNTDVSCSSLLLIEDSADSEGDSIGFFTLYPAANIGHTEEDAESCTCDCDCDIDGICSLVKEDEDVKGSGEFCWVDCSCFNSSMLMLEATMEIGCSSSPLLLVDEDEEVETRMVEVNVNDVDDKVFWEMCMAVGYP